MKKIILLFLCAFTLSGFQSIKAQNDTIIQVSATPIAFEWYQTRFTLNFPFANSVFIGLQAFDDTLLTNGWHPLGFYKDGGTLDTIITHYISMPCQRWVRVWGQVYSSNPTSSVDYYSNWLEVNSCMMTSVTEVKSENLAVVKFQIYDMQGRLVLERNGGPDENLKNEGVPFGIYLLITFDGKEFNRKEVFVQ